MSKYPVHHPVGVRPLAWRLLLAVSLALASASALAAPLTLAVARSPHSLPVFVAHAEGLFAAEGVDVKLVEAPSGLACLKLMAAGKAELGTAAETAITFESFERTDFSVIATFSSTANDVELVARAASGIKMAKDLKGKKVGVVKRTSAQFFLDTYLLNNNVDPQGVNQVALEPGSAVDALAKGQVDALAVFQPFAYQAAHLAKTPTVVLSDSGDYKQTFNLVAQNATLTAARTDVEKVLRAIQRASELIRAQPAKAAAVLTARLGADKDFADWALARTRYVLALDESLVRALQSQAQWAVREHYVGAQPRPDYRKLVRPEALAAVLPTAVGLQR